MNDTNTLSCEVSQYPSGIVMTSAKECFALKVQYSLDHNKAYGLVTKANRYMLVFIVVVSVFVETAIKTNSWLIVTNAYSSFSQSSKFAL